MGRPGLILVKDLKEAFGQRSMRVRALLGTAIMPIVAGLLPERCPQGRAGPSHDHVA